MKLVYFFMERIEAWLYARKYPLKRVTSIHSIQLDSLQSPYEVDETGIQEIHVTFQTQNHLEVMAIYYWDQETIQLHAAGYVEMLVGNYDLIPDQMIRPFTDEVFRKIRLQLIMEG